jgi:tetratricopeptide (TPR) repeat protein
MDHKKDRKDFAQARPIPAFGRVIALAVDCLQLKNPDSYLANSPQLQSALQVLAKRTSDTIFAGDMVTEASKLELSGALAQCIKAHPALPFDDVADEELADAIRALWSTHEHIAGLLTALPTSRELVRLYVRHVVVSLGIRAGAIAWLNGDQLAKDDIPPWAADDTYRRFLGEMLRTAFGTRDKTVAKLSELAATNSPGESEVDRWLDDLDIPAPNHIRNWDKVLAAASGAQDSNLNHHTLFRVCVGRRLWQSLGAVIPADLQDEALRAFVIITKAVHGYLMLETRGDAMQQRRRAITTALGGTITDPLLAFQVTQSVADPLWRAHVEALVAVDEVPTLGIVELSQTWLAVAKIYDGLDEARRPPSVDEFARLYFRKAEMGGSPSAEYAKLAEMGHRYLTNGELQKAATIAHRLIHLAPQASGPWELMATIRLFERRYDEAVTYFTKALHLEPRNITARGKLVTHLSSREQLGEAERILFEAAHNERDSTNWLFAHGNLLIRQKRYREAKEELLKCVRRGFLPRICYQLLVVAAAWLDEPDEQREYEKRAKEFE